jgi:hypothetical protein
MKGDTHMHPTRPFVAFLCALLVALGASLLLSTTASASHTLAFGYVHVGNHHSGLGVNAQGSSACNGTTCLVTVELPSDFYKLSVRCFGHKDVDVVIPAGFTGRVTAAVCEGPWWDGSIAAQLDAAHESPVTVEIHVTSA